jgi:hypothetical protein
MIKNTTHIGFMNLIIYKNQAHNCMLMRFDQQMIKSYNYSKFFIMHGRLEILLNLYMCVLPSNLCD